VQFPKILGRLAVLALACGGSVSAISQTHWSVAKTYPLGGQGAWDYLTVDASEHRLFVPRSTHMMVVDSEYGKLLGDIPGLKIAHGVAIVPSAGRGFISDGGGDGSVAVFDLKTYALLGRIATLPDSDGIIYDASQGLVLVVSGDKDTLMSFRPDIDLKAGKLDAPIDLGGAPEFLASDGAGKVYVNLMDKNEVATVDLKLRKVVARWPVAPGGAPVGMSIDLKRRLLFIGCRKPQMLVAMSLDTGKVVSAMPIGSSVDAVVVDRGQVFASCRDGSLSVAEEKSPGDFKVVQVVKTRMGASTMGLDPGSHQIYLPAAEFQEAAPGVTKRQMKPDSFMIVVVSQEKPRQQISSQNRN
jgi:DNA-binding beta-propeller fold protein YncE